jgi:hypothetical protein
MKTPMQELLEWAKDKDMSDTMISPQDLLNVINPLLEKEKEQIKDAYADGLNAHRTNFCNRDEYYNQTYNQQ